MTKLNKKLKGLQLNQNNILEQAIGALIADILFAVLLAFLGYLYNLVTGKTQPTIWLWAVLIGFPVIVIIGLVWKTISKLLIAIGRWIIQNWKLIASIVLILTVSYSSYLIFSIIWIPVLILGFTLAILLAVSWSKQGFERDAKKDFIPIELNPHNVANESLVNKYANPPNGLIILGGVSFFLNPKGSILDTSLVRYIEPDGTTKWELKLPEAAQNAMCVHLLINAGGGWERDPDTDTGLKWMKVGRIQLVFSDSTIQEVELRLGDNLREWAIGNFPGKLVDNVLDPACYVVWRGNTLDGNFAVIDKLEIPVLPTNLHNRLVSIVFRRDIQYNADKKKGGGVEFVVIGVSIEVRKR